MVPVRSRLLLVMVLSLLGGAIGIPVVQEATSESEGVTAYPPNEPVYGATLGEWSARHWRWTLSFPIGVNPGQDVTGTTCGYGQAGPVFFVPRNFPPCVVPSGMAILVPIAGAVCSAAEPMFVGQDEAALRSCVADDAVRHTGIVVRVDGETIPDINSYRAASPLFTVVLPENNVLGGPAGATSAAADGYQVILAPLSVGEHEVVVHVELTDGTVLPDKVLRMTVVEPASIGPGATPDLGTPKATPVL